MSLAAAILPALFAFYRISRSWGWSDFDLVSHSLFSLGASCLFGPWTRCPSYPSSISQCANGGATNEMGMELAILIRIGSDGSVVGEVNRTASGPEGTSKIELESGLEAANLESRSDYVTIAFILWFSCAISDPNGLRYRCYMT